MVLSALLATGRRDAGTVRERPRQTPMREALIVRTHDGLARAKRMAAAGGAAEGAGGARFQEISFDAPGASA